jgi:hypothetical protein
MRPGQQVAETAVPVTFVHEGELDDQNHQIGDEKLGDSMM